MRRVILAALCLGLVAGCKGTEVVTPKVVVSGGWRGSINQGGTPYTLEMVLIENAGVVTGTATLTGGTALANTVTGSYTAPTLGLSLSAPGYQPLNLIATVGVGTMTGTLNGSGFLNATFTLVKL
jgi:hypothetical protein